MKKIGLLGGGFDPIHLGHIGIALAAIEQLQLDEVWLIVTYQPNLKHPPLGTFFHRVAMSRLAAKPYPQIKVSAIEKTLPVPSYTINTISALKQQYLEHEFIFLIGSDQAAQLDSWHQSSRLQKMITFKVISRGNIPGDVVLAARSFPQSSTAIRQGRLDYLDPIVYRYILKHELYLDGIVERQLKVKRFFHTQGVITTALKLAKVHKIPRHQTYLAALFHDIAKGFSAKRLETYLDAQEAATPPGVWHQYVGAKIAKDYYHIDDPEIYDAIYNHTLGNSTEKLAMVIFCADKIEPSRGYDSRQLYKLCRRDLLTGFQTVKAAHQQYNGVKDDLQ